MMTFFDDSTLQFILLLSVHHQDTSSIDLKSFVVDHVLHVTCHVQLMDAQKGRGQRFCQIGVLLEPNVSMCYERSSSNVLKRYKLESHFVMVLELTRTVCPEEAVHYKQIIRFHQFN